MDFRCASVVGISSVAGGCRASPRFLEPQLLGVRILSLGLSLLSWLPSPSCLVRVGLSSLDPGANFCCSHFLPDFNVQSLASPRMCCALRLPL